MLIDRLLFADKTPLVLKKALDSQSDRQLLVSSNISNIDTPGYRAKDIDFKGALKAALGAGDGLALRTTHRGHIGPNKSGIRDLKAEPFVDLSIIRHRYAPKFPLDFSRSHVPLLVFIKGLHSN